MFVIVAELKTKFILRTLRIDKFWGIINAMLGFLISWFLIVVSLFCLIPFKPHPAPSGEFFKKQTYQFHLFNRIKSTLLFQPSGLFVLVCVSIRLSHFKVQLKAPKSKSFINGLLLPDSFGFMKYAYKESFYNFLVISSNFLMA